MSRQIQYTPEAIVDAAVDTIRTNGPSALTARNVASRMGGSTQPIYRAFASIEDLEGAVVERAQEIAFSYLRSATDDESAFLALGLGYLRFSREEPQLFRFVAMRGRASWSPDSPHWPLREIVDRMRIDPMLTELPEETLLALHRDMFVYTHGLCLLQNENPSQEDTRQEREILRQTGGRLILLAAMEARGEIDLCSFEKEFHP